MNNGSMVAVSGEDQLTAITRGAEERDFRPVVPHPAHPTVSVVKTSKGFDALREVWDELLANSGGRVFQSFEWQRTWWTHFGETDSHTQLHCVLIHEGDVLVGIAPFCIVSAPVVGAIRCKRLRFVGQGVTDYLDVICRTGREEVVIQALSQHLIRIQDQYDVMFLIDMPESSLACERLHRLLTEGGLNGSRFVSNCCPRMTLGDTWEATVASFPRSHRYRLRGRFNAVKEHPATSFVRVRDPREVETIINELVAIHQERWTSAGHPGALSDDRVVRFHREVAPLLCGRGWLFLASLSLGGKPIVVNYGFSYRGTTSMYITGGRREEGMQLRSAGLVTFMNCMVEAIREGDREFDFLRGPERFKYEFGAEDRNNWTILLYSHGQKVALWKHRAALLRAVVRRRLELEYSLLQYELRLHGVFSVSFWKAEWARMKVVIADARVKAKAPDRPMFVTRKQQDELRQGKNTAGEELPKSV